MISLLTTSSLSTIPPENQADIPDAGVSVHVAREDHVHGHDPIYTAADVMVKVQALDGDGSGLDADLLDGHHASYFAQSVHGHVASDITNSTTVGRSVLTALDAAGARTAIGAGTPYTLPVATGTILGGVKQGTGISIAGDGTASVGYGTTGTTACVGNDGRLSDARTPLAHTQAASTISDSTAVGRAVLMASDAAAARTAIGVTTYSLPIASASVLGGIKIGTGLSIDGSGVVSTSTTAPAWGIITGTLSAQTDLSTALGGKQATLGGTGFVKSTAGVISYDTSVYYLASNPSGFTNNAGTVTGVTATGPVVSSGGTAPVISMAAATTSVPGYLTTADWNTFNGKQAALGFTPYNATNPSGFIALSSAITGYAAGANAVLAATDTLNAALGKLQGQVAAREPAVGNPSVNGYVLSSTTAGVRSWVANGAGGGITALTGDVTASGSGSVAATLATTQAGAHTWSADQTLSSTTISISATTGALIVAGGIGVGGAIRANGTISAKAYIMAGDGTSDSNLTVYGSDGKGVVVGGDGVNLRSYIYYSGANRIEFYSATGTVKIPSVVASSSVSTGSLVVAGGVGVGGTLVVGGGIDIGGSLNVGGGIHVGGMLYPINATIGLNSSYGMLICGATGSSFDFGVTDSAGSPIIVVPTGTRNVSMPEALLVGNGAWISRSTYPILTLTSTATGSSAYAVAYMLGADTSAVGMFGLGGHNVSNSGLVDTQYFGTQNNFPLKLITNDTPRITVTGSGQVSISSTAASTSTTTGALVVSGGIGCGGIIYVSDGVVHSSDAKLKTGFTQIKNPLKSVLSLTGGTYTWNDLASSRDKTTEQVGILAHELLKVLPQAVYHGDYLAVDYGKITPLLIEAIKEFYSEFSDYKKAKM